MVRADIPPCRLVIWSHISGLQLPTDKILNYPDVFVFTIPLSNATSDVEELHAERKSVEYKIYYLRKGKISNYAFEVNL